MNIAPNQIGIPCGCDCSNGDSPAEPEYPEGCIVSAKGQALASGDGTIIICV